MWKLGWQLLFSAAGIGANSGLCTGNGYCVLRSNTVFYVRESSGDGMGRGWFLMVHITHVLHIHIVRIVIY